MKTNGTQTAAELLLRGWQPAGSQRSHQITGWWASYSSFLTHTDSSLHTFPLCSKRKKKKKKGWYNHTKDFHWVSWRSHSFISPARTQQPSWNSSLLIPFCFLGFFFCKPKCSREHQPSNQPSPQHKNLTTFFIHANQQLPKTSEQMC